MEYKITKDNEVFIIVDEEQIDKVGPFESKESAIYWAESVCDKYNSNPNFVYPNEKPKEEN